MYVISIHMKHFKTHKGDITKPTKQIPFSLIWSLRHVCKFEEFTSFPRFLRYPFLLNHFWFKMQDEIQKRNTDCVYFLASPLTCKKVCVEIDFFRLWSFVSLSILMWIAFYYQFFFILQLDFPSIWFWCLYLLQPFLWRILVFWVCALEWSWVFCFLKEKEWGLGKYDVLCEWFGNCVLVLLLISFSIYWRSLFLGFPLKPLERKATWNYVCFFFPCLGIEFLFPSLFSLNMGFSLLVKLNMCHLLSS